MCLYLILLTLSIERDRIDLELVSKRKKQTKNKVIIEKNDD